MAADNEQPVINAAVMFTNVTVMQLYQSFKTALDLTIHLLTEMCQQV